MDSVFYALGRLFSDLNILPNDLRDEHTGYGGVPVQGLTLTFTQHWHDQVCVYNTLMITNDKRYHIWQFENH